MGILDRVVTTEMANLSPHMRELGIRFLEAHAGVAKGELLYREDLVGDPATGVLHGGVVTTLLDSTGGAAVMSALSVPGPIATLDLRIDYLRPSTPLAPLVARVECYKVTSQVAFVRGTAYNLDARDPVAAMTATFMLHTQGLAHGAKNGAP